MSEEHWEQPPLWEREADAATEGGPEEPIGRATLETLEDVRARRVGLDTGDAA